jgi:Amiloride-sensitive sodium channel
MSLNLCGCVKFQLARIKTTRVCGLIDYQCFRDVDTFFHSKNETSLELKSCDCLLDCNSIKYEFKVIETKQKYEPHNATVDNQTQWVYFTFYDALSFAFGEDQYTALRCYASYELVSFMSDVGGLLGLFLGVSAMSAIEIFYFFFIRLTRDLVKYAKARKRVN